jgi:peptidoglycan/LPS O-acetylase OafA/YrhL
MGVVLTSEPAPSPALAPPPGNPRFPLCDGLRGLAVLGILAFHVSEFTGQIGYGIVGRFTEVGGGSAVITFFAISGFLLYRPFVARRLQGRARPALGRYVRRRALRILPAYWSVLTLLAIYPGITGAFSDNWWRYYGYLQLYSQRTQQLGIPVAWTLCVEVSFYILLPVWVLAVSRLRLGGGPGGAAAGELLALVVVACGGAVVQVAGARHWTSYVLATSLAGECTWIAIGMALAVVSAAGSVLPQLPRRARRLAALAHHPELCWSIAIASFVTMMATVPSGGLFGLIAAVQIRQAAGAALLKIALEVVFVTFLIAPVVFGDRGAGIPRRLLAWRPLVGLGVISYSFYLWHLTIVDLLARSRDPAAFSSMGWDLMARVHVVPTLVLFLLSLALTAPVAWASYRIVELPFLRRKEPKR